MTPAQAYCVETLWRLGRPTLALLDKGQQGWIATFRQHGQHGVWMVARQRGKTYAALTMAVELAMSTPGAIIRYAAKTGKSARSIVEPTMEAILATCPEELRPRQDNERGSLVWPNGSSLVWAGTDSEQFDRLRGPRAHLLLFDEAGFWPELERVESALLPMLQTTGGQALYLSTPSESPGHPFIQRYRAAQATGRAQHDTIEGNPRLSPADVQRILRSEAERLGMSLEEFRASTYCRREFYAEIVTEESRAAVPGWTAEMAQQAVGEWLRPTHFDALVSIDWGGYSGDPHAALFAHVNHKARELVIEDELEMRGATLKAFLDAVREKERALWGVDRWDGTLLALRDWKREGTPPWLIERIQAKAPRQPYLRVCDTDEALMYEAFGHGVALLPTPKHEKHLAVDSLDVLVRRGGLKVHSRCKRLREQLATTVWNRQRTEWERTAKDHGDLVDNAVYLNRNAPWNRDPAPPVAVDPWLNEVKRLQGAREANPLASLFVRKR